ncbi:hypothetical protein M5K25_022717 [Dendrobium thyrsiflorum]|uniref:Uncharacterized protein n=1 Tax=Dendrobium thyrsiflorum TaxID=117978 RepID=A0ABD0U6N2_DENTH
MERISIDRKEMDVLKFCMGKVTPTKSSSEKEADQVKQENMSNINAEKQKHEEEKKKKKKKKSNLENAAMAAPYFSFHSRPGIR